MCLQGLDQSGQEHSVRRSLRLSGKREREAPRPGRVALRSRRSRQKARRPHWAATPPNPPAGENLRPRPPRPGRQRAPRLRPRKDVSPAVETSAFVPAAWPLGLHRPEPTLLPKGATNLFRDSHEGQAPPGDSLSLEVLLPNTENKSKELPAACGQSTGERSEVFGLRPVSFPIGERILGPSSSRSW